MVGVAFAAAEPHEVDRIEKANICRPIELDDDGIASFGGDVVVQEPHDFPFRLTVP